jgi:hypothetical protein
MGKLITAREAAQIAARSRSQINRDAAEGKLPTAQKFPGYKGARLFDESDVAKVYEVELAEAVS